MGIRRSIRSPGKPLWAEPEFDDSKWETVDLTPKEGSFDPLLRELRLCAGLGSQGPSRLLGLRLVPHPGAFAGAARKEAGPGGPSDVDDAYQVFDNGELVGSFGDFSGSTPVVYYSQPMMFPLSQPAGGNPGSSIRVLAFRVWMEPNTLAIQPDAGGFHTRRCWARRARWQPVTRYAGWN